MVVNTTILIYSINIIMSDVYIMCTVSVSFHMYYVALLARYLEQL